MRALVATTLLFTAILAGCISSDTNGEPVAAEDYAAPNNAVQVDAAETLVMLREFSTTFPERADNLPAHTGARDWFEEQFESYGLEVYRQSFTNGIDQENILGILWGEDPNSWVVVGGHYDVATKDCAAGNIVAAQTFDTAPTEGQTCVARKATQGAYDDGSGTIQTVMLAKEFAAAYADSKPYHTLVFVLFDGEERGLQGSEAFAEAIIRTEESPYAPFPYNGGDIQIRGMLDLDMAGINWPGTDTPLYFDTNSVALRDRVDATRQEMEMPDEMIKFQGISLGRSDYAHFFGMGVPTGFFISNFEEFQLPGGTDYTTPPPPQETCDAFAASPRNPCTSWPAYPFWHLQDTWDTMVLMAGSEENLAAGFQTVLDLSVDALEMFAVEPTVELDAEIL